MAVSKVHRAVQEQDATGGSTFPRVSPLDDPPEFSERDYRISPSDSQGRVERIWVRLPPYLIRSVQVLVSKGPYPWETVSDAYRFAIYWGLRLLKNNPPPVVTLFAQTQAINDILTREQDNIQFRAIFEKLNTVVMEYQREGAMGEARRVLAEIDARINQMPAGYWQDKYRKALRDRFGIMMRGSRMALGSPTPEPVPPVPGTQEIVGMVMADDLDEGLIDGDEPTTEGDEN